LCVNATLDLIINIVTKMADNKVMKDISEDIRYMKRKLSVKRQIISLQKCNIEPQDSRKKWRGFMKRGVRQNSLSKHCHPSHMFLK
jgi:hypothetical protein